MKTALLFCVISFLPLSLHQPDITLPEFADILITVEDGRVLTYMDGESHDSTSSLQNAIDSLDPDAKNSGILMRFDHRTVPLAHAVKTAEAVYQCGVPAVYLFDLTMGQSPGRILEDPFLVSLSAMPSKGRLLRMLDLNKLIMPHHHRLSEKVDIKPANHAVFTSIIIIFIGGLSYMAGFFLARSKSSLWITAYAIPLLLTLIITAGRLFPTLEMQPVFRIFMYGHREYILMAAATALLLGIPAARLKHKRVTILTTAFAALSVVQFSVLPFLLPAFNRESLLNLNPDFDRFGVCMQTTPYTCGPAAAVTALREKAVFANEGELAVMAGSTTIAGTSPELLCRAIENLYGSLGVECEFRSFETIDDITTALPLIAVFRLGFLVDHFVTVLRVTDKYITVADPEKGMRIMSHDNFMSEWRRSGIIIKRTDPLKE